MTPSSFQALEWMWLWAKLFDWISFKLLLLFATHCWAIDVKTLLSLVTI